jgi:hypothetical protein
MIISAISLVKKADELLVWPPLIDKSAENTLLTISKLQNKSYIY